MNLRKFSLLGICLPLALVVGYLLAEPMDVSGMGVVLLVVAVLLSPLLIWWHHPLLVGTWNAALWVGLLPGSPMLWMVVALAGFFFAVLGRAVDASRKFVMVRAMNWALFFLLVVVVGTAFMTGGIGMNVLGSSQFGGRNYMHIVLAVLGYLTLTSRAVPVGRGNWYAGLFFLPGLTAIVGNVVYMAGASFWFLFWLFPVGGAYYQYAADMASGPSVMRVAGASGAGTAVWSFLLARYGVAGVFDLGRPWRLLLFVSAVGFGLLGGFRSEVVMFGLVFGLTFHLEKLWRTRLAVGLCLVGLLLGGLAVGFTRQLPWSVQRSLSVLPLDVEPVARMDAAGSSEWRLEMWRRVWQEVPHYLWKGKGYNLNPHDMGLVEEAMRQGHVSGYELALFAGDYHSGPLSVLMPFGIYGAVAFLMLFGTGGWVLWRNWRHGRGELVNVNRFLLALYGAKIIFFMTVFGSASSDLAGFLGIIGLGVSLNHGVATPPTEVAA